MPMVDRLMIESVLNEKFGFERMVIGVQVEG